MDWTSVLKAIAPTVGTALLGPLGGVAVSALGNILGVSEATQDKIADVIKSGAMTPEQVTAIKELELKYQAEEKERGFRYEELAFKDRDSARTANVSGGTQVMLFWLSILLLIVTLGTEIAVLFGRFPTGVPELVIGRVLGLMDSVALLVLTYWYGTTNSSSVKTGMLAAQGKT